MSPKWRKPAPLGYANAIDSVGGVAAPLLGRYRHRIGGECRRGLLDRGEFLASLPKAPCRQDHPAAAR